MKNKFEDPFNALCFPDIVEISGHIMRKIKSIIDKHDNDFSGNMRDGVMGYIYADMIGMIEREFGCKFFSINRECLFYIHDFIDCYEVPTIVAECFFEPVGNGKGA